MLPAGWQILETVLPLDKRARTTGRALLRLRLPTAAPGENATAVVVKAATVQQHEEHSKVAAPPPSASAQTAAEAAEVLSASVQRNQSSGLVSR